MMHFILILTIFMQWFRSFVIWVFFEVVIASSAVVFVTHLLIPLYIQTDVRKVKKQIVSDIVSFKTKVAGPKSHGQNAIEDLSASPTDTLPFNAAKYLFVSWRLAHLFPDIEESKIISRYSTIWPTKSFNTKGNTVETAYDSRLAFVGQGMSRIVLFFLTNLISLPQFSQDIILQILNTAGFGYIIVLAAKLYNIYPLLLLVPIALAVIVVHFFVSTNKITEKLKRQLEIAPIASKVPVSNPAAEVSGEEESKGFSSADESRARGRRMSMQMVDNMVRRNALADSKGQGLAALASAQQFVLFEEEDEDEDDMSKEEECELADFSSEDEDEDEDEDSSDSLGHDGGKDSPHSLSCRLAEDLRGPDSTATATESSPPQSDRRARNALEMWRSRALNSTQRRTGQSQEGTMAMAVAPSAGQEARMQRAVALLMRRPNRSRTSSNADEVKEESQVESAGLVIAAADVAPKHMPLVKSESMPAETVGAGDDAGSRPKLFLRSASSSVAPSSSSAAGTSQTQHERNMSILMARRQSKMTQQITPLDQAAAVAASASNVGVVLDTPAAKRERNMSILMARRQSKMMHQTAPTPLRESPVDTPLPLTAITEDTAPAVALIRSSSAEDKICSNYGCATGLGAGSIADAAEMASNASRVRKDRAMTLLQARTELNRSRVRCSTGPDLEPCATEPAADISPLSASEQRMKLSSPGQIVPEGSQRITSPPSIKSRSQVCPAADSVTAHVLSNPHAPSDIYSPGSRLARAQTLLQRSRSGSNPPESAVGGIQEPPSAVVRTDVRFMSPSAALLMTPFDGSESEEDEDIEANV
jgi:hypothetical protein